MTLQSGLDILIGMIDDTEGLSQQDAIDAMSMMAALGGLGSGNITYRRLIDESGEIARKLRRLDLTQTAATFAGLLTAPKIQDNCYRIEALVHLALAMCTGKQKASDKFFSQALRDLGEGLAGRMEDPAEDVFVAAVRSPLGNFRVLEGVWEGNSFFLQRFVELLQGMPASPGFDALRASVFALLRLSDAVCERAKLARWELGGDESVDEANASSIGRLLLRKRHIRFRIGDLKNLGVDVRTLSPFLFDLSERERLLDHYPGNSGLERRPLVLDGDHLWFMLPTAASSAIRYHIIERCIAAGQVDTLHGSLASIYSQLFRRTPLLGGPSGAPIQFALADTAAFAEVMTEVDTGRHIHYLFFTDRLDGFEETGLAGINPAGTALGEELEARVAAAYQDVSELEDYRGGLTVIIGCGVGRGSSIAFGRSEMPGWRVEFVSAYDFYTLSWTPDFKPLTLWRVLEARDEVERLGLTLFNVNGLLNLVGWARALDGHLVPHSSLPASASGGGGMGMLLVDQASQRAVRHESATTFDPRVEQDINGRWLRIRRPDISIFDDDKQAPSYASEGVGESERPMSVYLAPKRAWWADVFVEDTVPGAVAYERWKVVEVWLTRAVPRLDAVLKRKPGPVLWRARFLGDFSEMSSETNTLTYEEARAEIAVEVDRERGIITTVASARYELAHFNVENVAERALIAALIEGVAELTDGALNAETRSELLTQIVRGPQARQGHAFRAREFLDFVHSDLNRQVVNVAREDDASLRLGLGWKVRERSAGGQIDGKAECTSFLNAVVTMLENRLCEELREFNREEFLITVVRNSEAATFDRDRWRRTASAVLALHDDLTATMGTITHHEFKLNATFQASRILVEFGICECPVEGGKQAGELDLSRLMALAALIFALGGWSDAIRWGLMEPKLRVTELGDIHADFGWMDEVVLPFATRTSDDRINSAVEAYSSNLEDRPVNPNVENELDPAFCAAWKEQFGAGFDETRVLVDFLEEKGIAAGKAVFTMARSEFRDITSAGISLCEPAASSLIDALTFKPRSQWRNTPAGFEDRDRFPWRFRRQLSCLRRPLFQLDERDDPTILIAPSAFRSAFIYTAINLLNGDFPDYQLSPSMKAWRARTVGNRGTIFATQVAEKLKSLGWQTRTEVNVTEALGRGFERDYGDIDVLAWNHDAQRVLIIECKDVQYKKTEGEIAEQLADFRGEVRTNGRRDELRKHLDRMDVIRDHLPALARFVGISQLTEAESHLLFRNPVPMKFALASIAEKVHVSTFDEVEIGFALDPSPVT